MSALPKPPPCHQNWLAMKPTAHGRHCGQCDKEIYDFSRLSWAEIERVQATHGNALCGIYAPAQLRHWGRQPPPACAPLAAAAALAAALTSLSAAAQQAPAAPSLTLSGTVSTLDAKGKREPVPFATVLLVGSQLGTTTDEAGYYQLTLPADSPANATIAYQSLGFRPIYFPLSSPGPGALSHDALLVADSKLIGFYVQKPSVFKRISWRVKRWFSAGSGQ